MKHKKTKPDIHKQESGFVGMIFNYPCPAYSLDASAC